MCLLCWDVLTLSSDCIKPPSASQGMPCCPHRAADQLRGSLISTEIPMAGWSWGVKVGLLCASPCSWLQLSDGDPCLSPDGKPQTQHHFCFLKPSAAAPRAHSTAPLSHLDLHISMSWLFTALSVISFPLFSPSPMSFKKLREFSIPEWDSGSCRAGIDGQE